MRYQIALHKSEEGISVSVPGLPGCWSQGSNERTTEGRHKSVDCVKKNQPIEGTHRIQISTAAR